MAADVVLSFNQITFRTGLLLSLRIEKLYHVNDHKSANRVGIAVFSSGQLSLKRRQQRLGGEYVRSSDIAGSGKFRLHQLHLANGQARP
jgi:hypothetical protein